MTSLGFGEILLLAMLSAGAIPNERHERLCVNNCYYTSGG